MVFLEVYLESRINSI